MTSEEIIYNQYMLHDYSLYKFTATNILEHKDLPLAKIIEKQVPKEEKTKQGGQGESNQEENYKQIDQERINREEKCKEWGQGDSNWKGESKG